MIYQICTYGNPVLREKATAITEVTDEIQTFVGDMLETLKDQNGLGLAAQQVGRTESLCVVDVPPEHDENASGERENPEVVMPMVIMNPKLVDHSDKKNTREEGCLSFPGIYANVVRPAAITLEYMNLAGETCRVELKGLVARAVQHEMDHLAGVVFVDRMSHVKKMTLSGKLKRLSLSTREDLGLV